MATSHRLPFEKPIYELEGQLAHCEAATADSPQAQAESRRLRRELARLKREIYENLDPWDVVQVARHPERPQTTDYLDILFEDFVELHGDRAFGDDRAIRTGFVRLGDHKLMFVGHQKGRTVKERQACYFGCAHPEGYRKALSKMTLAAKFHLPIVCFIDTPGAYPGIGAEERGQAQIIAVNLMEMARLPTPIICIVIGEGGSGGALGIGVGDKVSVLEHAYYSVISPEGCAGILWKSGKFAPQAAAALKMTAKHLLRLGIVDDVIPEPLGGAHRDHRQMAGTLRSYLLRYLKELRDAPEEELLKRRYDKFRRIGVFSEGISEEERAAVNGPTEPDARTTRLG
ncbi:MAG: acetyl-CoA carboxylase carboxyltransferase subunit alpha [Planctomycetes bacterium]|nr:acetyl-CoA carboxylase carboxyltransferase subunit alpha [Planctomycetota bacterium]